MSNENVFLYNVSLLYLQSKFAFMLIYIYVQFGIGSFVTLVE